LVWRLKTFLTSNTVQLEVSVFFVMTYPARGSIAALCQKPFQLFSLFRLAAYTVEILRITRHCVQMQMQLHLYTAFHDRNQWAVTVL
jgi:hypothetical protein